MAWSRAYQTICRTANVELFGVPAGIVILGTALPAAIALVFAIARARPTSAFGSSPGTTTPATAR
ncbi:hypothetical protein ACW2Q0_02780 [Nocardia sp. R16R-3T]